MLDLACVGIMVADVITKPVDSMPEKGLLVKVDSIELFNGGNAMTAALNSAKLGARSAVIGKIGNDFFGKFLKEKLQMGNVVTEGVSVDENVQTSASIALSSSDGERTFLHCVGANGTFSIDDINRDIIDEAKIVFVTGTFLLKTFDGEQTARFLKECKEKGKITALDVCWDSSNRWNELLDCAMPYIDIFMPSIDEAVNLAGGEENPDKIADIFFQKGVKKVVIKLGSRGCYLRESKESPAIILPCYKNVKVVDTTGAGDSFCSGFLTGYAKGFTFEECGRFANAVGAHCVSAQGATTGIKPMEEILKFMEENKQ